MTNSARFPGLRQMLRDRVLVLLVSVCLGTLAAHSQNATWSSTPGTNVWNTDSNWTTPATVPTGTAIFDLSNTTAIQFAPLSTTAVGTLHFDPGAPDYTFSLLDNTLTINAAGIVNDSANSPTLLRDLCHCGGPSAGAADGSAELAFEARTAGNTISSTITFPLPSAISRAML